MIDLEQFLIGYTLQGKTANKTPVKQLTNDVLVQLRKRAKTVLENDPEDKVHLPAIYKYVGIKGENFKSDIFFIDIDTTAGVDELLGRWDELCEVVPSIIFAQKSAHGKLHMVCRAYKTYTDKDKYADDFKWFAVVVTYAIANYVHGGYNYYDTKDDKGEPAMDMKECEISRSLFVTNHYIYWNPNEPAQPEYVKTDDMVKKFAKDYPQWFGGLHTPKGESVKGDFHGTFTIGNPHTLEIGSDFVRCGFSGNDLRWKIGNCFNYLCGWNREKAQKYLDTYFVGRGRRCVPTSNKNYDRNVMEWLEREFDIMVVDKEVELTTKQPNTNAIKLASDEWVWDKKDEIVETLNNEKKVLLVSNTGTGKTDFIRKYALTHEKTTIVTPFNSMLTQYSGSEFNVISSTTRNDFSYTYTNVTIWDQFVKNWQEILRNTDTLVLDESHTLFSDRSYRESAVRTINIINDNFDGKLLCVTATPTKEADLFGINSTLEYRRERKPVTCNIVITANVYGSIKKIVNEHHNGYNKRRLALFDNRYARRAYDEFSYDTGFEKYTLVHSRTLNATKSDDFGLDKFVSPPKGYERAVDCIKSEQMNDNITFFTSIAYSGLNFNDEDDYDVVVTYEYGKTDAAYIIQALGRLRKSKNITLWLVAGAESKENYVDIDTRLEWRETLDNAIEADDEIAELFSKDWTGDDKYEPTVDVLKELEDYYTNENNLKTIVKKLAATGYIAPIRIVKNYSVDAGQSLGGHNTYHNDASRAMLYNLSMYYGKTFASFKEATHKLGHYYMDEALKMMDRVLSVTKISYPTLCDYIIDSAETSNITIKGIVRELHELWFAWNLDDQKVGHLLAMDTKQRKKHIDNKLKALGITDKQLQRAIRKRYKNVLEYYSLVTEYGKDYGYDFDETLNNYIETGLKDKNQQLLAAKKLGGGNNKPQKVVFVDFTGDSSMLKKFVKNKEMLSNQTTKYAFISVGEAQRALGLTKRTWETLKKGKGKLSKWWSVGKTPECNENLYELVRSDWTKLDVEWFNAKHNEIENTQSDEYIEL